MPFVRHYILAYVSDGCVYVAFGRDILLFPNGANGTGKALSIFLNVPVPENLPLGWSWAHSFKLTVVDQLDATYSVVRGGPSYLAGKRSTFV